MGEFILNVMSNYGYFGIFFLIAIENLFPPIPSEVILTFGGFATTYTKLTFTGVVLSATIGSLIGAIILYYVGALIKVKKTDLAKTNNWFNKYGTKAVFFGRFIPIIRSLISIPAGANKMRMSLFVIYTTIGSLLWNIALVSAGALLGENWPIVSNILNKYSKVVLVIIILYMVVKGYKIIRKKEN